MTLAVNLVDVDASPAGICTSRDRLITSWEVNARVVVYVSVIIST